MSNDLPQLKVEISCDDGQAGDIRIADLMYKLDLKGTFYIPNHCGLDKAQILELSKEHEIGGHTVSHFPDLKKLNDNDLEYEIKANKEYLEGIIGKKITKFCYPRGRYDDRVVKAVKKAGYEYARTTQVLSIEHPTDMFRVKTTIHAYPHRLEYDSKNWFSLARKKFLLAKMQGGYFHLWFHSLEVKRYDQFAILKDIFELIKRNTK